MAVQRDDPYGQFNFLVDFGAGTDGPQAGFQECSQIGTIVELFEYRNGNDKPNEVRKIAGLSRVPDITLKRGVIGALDLYQWLNDVRNGARGARTVLIQLQNEDRTEVVLTWKLFGALPVRHFCGPLNAKSTDVAIEELTLAVERVELE
jgi:phage tail-like protein